jgi:signal transduction histidine kinase/photosystem II stability/assembly factor-like uncharacterized protein
VIAEYKRFSFSFRLILVLFFSVTFSGRAAQTWQIVKSPTHQNLARIDLLDETAGWIISYDGLILKYNGHTWEIDDNLQNIVQRNLTVPDSARASAAEWGDFYAIRTVSPAHGLIAVNHHQYHFYRLLQYNGQVWLPAPEHLPLKIRAIDFLNPEFGMAVGESGALQFKNSRWQTIQLPVTVDFRAVKIVAVDNIFIAGENGTILHKTTRWQHLPAPTSALLRDLDFISPEEGWFVGNSGTILHYFRGRISSQNFPTDLNLWAVDMLSDTLGFAVGAGGLILKFDGQTWTRQKTTNRSGLHDIEMLDPAHGWIVGGQGTILKYSPGQEIPARPAPHGFLLQDQAFTGTRHLIDNIDDVQGVAAADFNNDGQVDFYLTCSYSLNHLLINQGQGYFVDFTIESGTGGNIESRRGKQKFESGALVADFDRDGDVDIVLADRSGSTHLLLNDGNAIFHDGTRRAGFPENLRITAGTLGDFNGDGYPDLALADEFRGLRILENQKYNRFHEKSPHLANLPETGIRTLAVTDFDGNFRTDILVFFQQTTPVVLLNQGNAWQIQSGIFAPGSSPSGFITAATLADFNGDATPDLFLTTENGADALFLFEQGWFVDHSADWGILQHGRSSTAAAADFDADGDLDLYVSRSGPDFLYLNQNQTRFTECASDSVASKAGYLSGYNTGTATADIDSDGDPDLLVGNLKHWSSILENNHNPKNYLSLKIIGVEDTFEAFGAKVWLWSVSPDTAPVLLGFREINPARGFSSQNTNELHFGLGNFNPVDVQIRFLNGQETWLRHQKSGSRVTVYQAAAGVRHAFGVIRRIARFFHTPFFIFETVKLLLFLLAIFLSVRFIEKRYHWRPTRLVIFVLVVVAIYGALSLLLPRTSGFRYWAMPFLMLFFALLLLISVNEQIRRANLQQDRIDRKVRETSAALARTLKAESAISLVQEAISSICLPRSLVFYLYFPDGNYFLLKQNSGLQIDSTAEKFSVERGQLQEIQNAKSPLEFAKFANWLPVARLFDAETWLFPLAQESKLQGLVFVRADFTEAPLRSCLNYLFSQLAVTLNSIRMSQQIQEQRQLAAIGTFSSGLIHNLKNPLEGLRMISEVLFQKTSPDDSRYEYVAELYQGVLKLKNSLIQLFDVIKVTHKTTEVFDLNTLASELVQQSADRHNPPLVAELDRQPLQMKGSRSQLKIAFENMIQNAYEATGFTEPIRIRTKLLPEKKMIQVEIIDRGAGIPAKNLDKIFDIFYSTRGKGRGLGLTITRNIILNHQGFLNVTGSPGTTISVILPEFSEEPHSGAD